MSHNVSNDTVVVNMITLQEVPFLYGENGEIKFNSYNPNDNDETCIVTTYQNLHKMLQERKELNDKTKKFYRHNQKGL